MQELYILLICSLLKDGLVSQRRVRKTLNNFADFLANKSSPANLQKYVRTSHPPQNYEIRGIFALSGLELKLIIKVQEIKILKHLAVDDIDLTKTFAMVSRPDLM
jgi:hypothetical protein